MHVIRPTLVGLRNASALLYITYFLQLRRHRCNFVDRWVRDLHRYVLHLRVGREAPIVAHLLRVAKFFASPWSGQQAESFVSAKCRKRKASNLKRKKGNELTLIRCQALTKSASYDDPISSTSFL